MHICRYAPQGEVTGLKVALPDLAKVCALCNQASIHYDTSGLQPKYERVGEPTEAALKVPGLGLGLGFM